MAADKLIAKFKNNALTRSLIDEIEESVANLSYLMVSHPIEIRASIWIPLSDAALLMIEEDTDAASFFLPLVDDATNHIESYERSNYAMELLSRGVGVNSPLFRSERYIAAALLYNPFIKGAMLPSQSAISRLLRDLNVSSSSDILSPEIEAARPTDWHTIPQTFPALGILVASGKWPICDENGVIKYSMWALRTSTSTRGADMHKDGGKDKDEDVEAGVGYMPKGATFDERMKALAGHLEIRLCFVNLAFNLDNRKALVKYKTDVISDAEALADIPLTATAIGRLYPFEMPREDETIGEGPDYLSAAVVTSKAPSTAYTIYGDAGPMLVFLDYRHGEKRFLPMQKNKASPMLSASQTLSNLLEMLPPAVSSDMKAVISMQHIRFITAHIHPSMLMPSKDNPRRSFVFQKGWEGEEEKETIKRATDSAIKYLSAAALRKTTYIAALLTMYRKKFGAAIEEDIYVGVLPFSQASKSGEVMLNAEHKIHEINRAFIDTA